MATLEFLCNLWLSHKIQALLYFSHAADYARSAFGGSLFSEHCLVIQNMIASIFFQTELVLI